MKQHERDYFVSRIRCNFYNVKFPNLTFKVLHPKIEDTFEANQVYCDSYNSLVLDGIKTQEEMEEWMIKSGMWTEEDEEKREGLEKDIEKLKIEIFNYRNQESQRETIRKYLRAGEKQLSEHTNKKMMFYENTSECMAQLDRYLFLIRKSTLLNSSPYEFNEDSPIGERHVWIKLQSSLCREKAIRELARTEPWGSVWSLKDTDICNIFSNDKDQELSVDQRNLVFWSRMYDNVNESYESPARDVIEDDDLLDGWLIIQHKKREADRTKSELENTMNDKVKNSDEIFMMAGSKKDANRIDSMNSLGGKMVKKERKEAIQRAGKLSQQNLPDQKILIQNQVNQQYKDKFGR